MHREVALAALQAGKHLWVEKPVGRGLEDTQAVAEAARRAGVVTAVGFCYRFAPAVQHARALIASGAIGEVNHYRGTFLADYANRPDAAASWRFERAAAGSGALGDLMAHVVDLTHHLVGPIERLSGRTATMIPKRPRQTTEGTHFSRVESDDLVDVENEDWAGALVELAGGTVGSIEASRVAVGPRVGMGFEVHGTEGALSWELERMNELRRFQLSDDGDEGYTTILVGAQHPDFAAFQPGAGVPMGYDDLRVLEARNFLTAVRDGRQREPGVDEMLATARVLDAIERSAGSGAWEATAMTPKVANAPLSYGAFEMTVGTDFVVPGARAHPRGDRRRRLRGHRPRPARLLRRGRRAARAAGGQRPRGRRRLRPHAILRGRGVRGGRARPAPHAGSVRRRRRDRRATRAVRRGRARARRQSRSRRRGAASCGSATSAGARSPTTWTARPTAARERGYEPVFHHHTSTYVEGLPEIERFLEDTDVELLLDSGHIAVAGGDAKTALGDWSERIGAVHIKDVRLDVLAGVKAERADTLTAWRRGLFCALGQGDVDLGGFCGALTERGYDGWVVVEQDRVLGDAGDFDAAAAEQVANREWLREHAGW